MKRTALIQELGEAECYLERHGKRHDIFVNPRNGKKAPIPRHGEIKESLCRLIKRQLGIE